MTLPSACSSKSVVDRSMRSVADRDTSEAISSTTGAEAAMADSERRSSSPAVMLTAPPALKSKVLPTDTSKSEEASRTLSEEMPTELVETTSIESVKMDALSVARTEMSAVMTSTESPASSRRSTSASAVTLPPRTLRRSVAKASKERPASREMRAEDTSTFSRASTFRPSATRFALRAIEPVTEPYALSVASTTVSCMCPPAAMSMSPTTSVSRRLVRTSIISTASSLIAVDLAEMLSVAATTNVEPLVTETAALARARPPPTVAARFLSTSSSALPVATCTESATARDRFASISKFRAVVEMFRVFPESTSISPAASVADSAADASKRPPELTETDEPAATSKLRPTLWIMSSAASTNSVVVSRAISWTAEMSKVLLSMTYMSVDETSIADMTTVCAMSALTSNAPPECMPSEVAATVSIVDAVMFSCSPTEVAAWRPVRMTESRISICISSPAAARMPPTAESSMFGVEMLTRSEECTFTIGDVRIVSSNAVSSSVLPMLPVKLVRDASTASSAENSAEPPMPSSRSPMETSTLSKALTSKRSEVTLAISPAATVTVSCT